MELEDAMRKAASTEDEYLLSSIAISRLMELGNQTRAMS